jgi:hypothetical protein
VSLGSNARATVAGFLGAVVVLGGLLWVVGVDSVVRHLVRADLGVVVVLLVVACLWQLAWGLALRTVLGVLDTPIPVREAFFVFMAATFANAVTPFGQAGGEPVTAWLVADRTDTDYEAALASIASVDALNFVPSIGFGLLGVAYFAATITLGRRLFLAGTTVAVFAVALVVGVTIAWRHRYRIERVAVAALTPAIRWAGRVLPAVTPPRPATLEDRIEGFFGTIERIGDDRWGLLTALGFSALGWLGLMTCLWLSLYALGYVVPFAAVLVAVPLGAAASVTPLPGGLGGVEAVLVAVLIPTTSLGAATVGAAVFLHRLGTYWFPMLIGGSAASAFGTVAWE